MGYPISLTTRLIIPERSQHFTEMLRNTMNQFYQSNKVRSKGWHPPVPDIDNCQSQLGGLSTESSLKYMSKSHLPNQGQGDT